MTGSGGQLGRALGPLVPGAILLGRQSLDVTDRSAVGAAVGRHRPAVVVHAAAYTRVDEAERDPEGAAAVNVDGTRNVAEAAEASGAMVVYPSTDYVFSGEKGGAYREDDEPAPLCVYGATKLEGERVVESLERHLIVRTSWVFGDGRNFVRTVLAAAGRAGEVTVVGDQWGLPTNAADLALGILGLLERKAAGRYHLAGGGDPATWADVAEAALAAAGVRAVVRRVSTAQYRAGRQGPLAARPANSVLDCSKAGSLGVSLRPWREALAEYVQELAVRESA